MDLILGLLTFVGTILIWIVWSSKRYGARPFPDATHYAITRDGWRIALSRYEAHGEKKKTPVIICHGVGCNSLTFDFEQVSLARWLSGNGHDVWLLDLRGHGFSEFPSLQTGKDFGWSCDTYLNEDIPAAIDYVRKTCNVDQVNWIGLSMGGNLMLAYLASGQGEKIRSVITIGSSLDYSESESDYHKVLPILQLLRWLPAFPVGVIFKLQSPFVGRFANALEAFNYYPQNVNPDIARSLYASGLHAVSTPVFLQLSTLFEEGGMRTSDNKRHFFDGLVNVKTPVYSIAGDRDLQCPIDASEKSHMWIGSEDKQIQVFGKEQGHSTHYGHMDLVFGNAAEQEVWPTITDWLKRHD